MGGRLENSAEINLATNLVKNTVSVYINGLKTNALVDTGASITVISHSFLCKTSFDNAVLQKPDFHFFHQWCRRSFKSAWKIEITIVIQRCNFYIFCACC